MAIAIISVNASLTWANDPGVAYTIHSQNNIQLVEGNDGTLASNSWESPVFDPLSGVTVNACYFPAGSGLVYRVDAALMVGGVKGSDTSVSWWQFRTDGLTPKPFTYQSIDTRSPYYSPDARSQLDIVCDYYDTVPDVGYFQERLNLGLHVNQRTMAWSGGHLGDFILSELKITSLTDVKISNLYLGISFMAWVFHESEFSNPNLRSYTGFLKEYRDNLCGLNRTNLAYAMTCDGHPDNGLFDYRSPLGSVGFTILATPSDSAILNYNWMDYSGLNPYPGWWQPQQSKKQGEPFVSLTGENAWFPPRDKILYFIMSRPEVDYDQMTVAINRSAQGWNAPPPGADEMARGGGPAAYLSSGPFSLGPGQQLQFVVALVAGDSVHTDPTAFERLFDPQNPWPFYNQLDFSNLAENTMWARWVYDNPGVDTDGDGYFGKYRLCNGDTVWYEGDGVPDFRADVPPPEPIVRVIPLEGKLIIRWNGYNSETNVDPFTRVKDFEGYRVYAGLDKRKSVMTLLSSYDKENYNRYIYRQLTETRSEWRNTELPFTLDSLKLLYDDPDFDPLLCTRVDPLVYNDSFFYFEKQDFNMSDLSRQDQIHKAYPMAPFPGTDSTKWTEDDLTMEHGRPLPKYWEYEYVYDNLLPTIPYFVAVTAFDFGFAKGGIPSKESSILDAEIESYAQLSSDTVMEYGLDAYVYPNPWRSDENYRARGYENRDQSQIPNRSRRIHFANLPAKCKISIFSLDGDLIREIDHDYPPDSPQAMHDEWDLITRNTMLVVPGLYYYVIESATRTQIGKFVIIM